MIHAAGIMFLTPNGETLLLKRGPGGDHAGEWCFPGGHIEDGETPEQAAVRECEEELGFCPDGKRSEWTRSISNNATPIPAEDINPQPAIGEPVDYTTFIQRVEDRFDPVLNGEHTAFAWCKISTPAEPLHPGCWIALERIAMNETDIAEAIRDRKLTSPQKFENVWLFDMRITGTGTAYRHRYDEYAYRPPENYLTPDFLKRCNGLPVVWEHPPKEKLDTKEFLNRVIGAIMLPYIRGDEVWGVARIYDDEAAEKMTNEQLSTSPGVVFRKTDGNFHATADDGSNLLIEGSPSLLDHLAVCELGVWDKGGPPVGIETADAGKGSENMASEEVKGAEERVDSGFTDVDKLLEAVKTVADSVKSLHSRMDSYDRRMDDDEDDTKRARKDDDEDEDEVVGEAKELAADKAKRGRKDDDEDAKRKRHDAKTRKDVCDEDDDEDARKRHDDDEDEEDERKDRKRVDAKRKRHDDDEDDRRADSALIRKLAAVEKVMASMPKNDSDEDYAAMADAQARADSVYSAFSERAPRPLAGETIKQYRVRLLKGVQKYSKDWKDATLRILDDAVLNIAEKAIYADAQAASRDPMGVPSGHLREVRKRDATGREIVEFMGSWGDAFGEFRTAPRSMGKPFFRQPKIG
jgi:8-oxo-dGTP pyrophosphatase MutT (NUDIX family)